MKYITNYLYKFEKIVFISTIALISIIGSLNYYLGKDLNLFILFLIPCVFSAWFYKSSLLSKFSVFISVFINLLIDLNLKFEVSIFLIFINNILRLLIFIWMIYLVLYIKKINQKLENLSLLDPLTNLNNKRAYLINGDNEIKKMKRYVNPLSIIYLDLDNFKLANDTFGHDKGDELLILTANILKRNLRETDIIARIGGDEFAIILPNTNENVIKEKINFIHTELSNAYENICPCNVTSSIGIVTFYNQPKNIYEATSLADKTMYKITQLSHIDSSK